LNNIISAAVIGAIAGAFFSFLFQKILLRQQRIFYEYLADNFSKGSSDIVKTQIFMELRKSYLDVISNLDHRYINADWDPRNEDSEIIIALRDYWYQTFNEWYVTNILNEGKYADLWTSFYEKAVSGGLKNKPLRIIGCELFNGGSTFSGFKNEFKREIKRIYEKEYRVDFFGDTGIPENKEKPV
jgi:6-pyruvoyl-tetrahydropterin synthase